MVLSGPNYGVHYIQKYHVVPVKITIENQSATAWILADKNIALKKLTINQVNAKLFASRRWLPLWIFLGGIGCAAIMFPFVLYYGLLCTTTQYMLSVHPILAIFALLTELTLMWATPCIAIAYAVSNHMSRNEMRRYLKTYCTAEGLTLNEGISASMLFFVEESQLPEKLKLVLTD